MIPLLLLHANFILDTGITLVRRIITGQRWYAAHREHFYQRLVRSGKSHAFVTGWELGLQGTILGLMIAYVFASPVQRVVLASGTVGVWLGFFGYYERELRKAPEERRGKSGTQLKTCGYL
ncbi:MAG: hypothetical protein ACYDH9_26405 [Limisphaerales bacterium]